MNGLVEGFVRSAATELPRGIRINCVSPAVLAESAARHAEAALGHVASGNYEGEHWLASFAVYMLSVKTEE